MSDSEDYIIKEIPVNLVKMPNSNLISLEFDGINHWNEFRNKTTDKDISKNENCINIADCSVNSRTKDIEINVEMNQESKTFGYHKSQNMARNVNKLNAKQHNNKDAIFEKNIIENETYQSKKLTDAVGYSRGVLVYDNNQLYLTPINDMYLMTPTFPHLNKVFNKSKKPSTVSSSKVTDNDNPDDPDAIKKSTAERVVVRFAGLGVNDEKSKKATAAKKSASVNDPMIKVAWNDVNSNAAEHERSKLRKVFPKKIDDKLPKVTFTDYTRQLFPLQSVNNESDDESEILLKDLMPSKPILSNSVDSIVVVDGIPKVKPELFKKLHTVLTKLFGKFGTIVSEHYCLDENEHTKGFVFIEYEKAHNATEAIKLLDNHKMDKTHTLRVNSLNDFDKLKDMDDNWVQPEKQAFDKKVELYTHMLDTDAFDQFAVLIFGKAVEIWKNTLPELTLVDKRPEWTLTYVKWSPKGAFLATFHTKGLLLWAGEKFEKYARYPHERVEYIDFSPNEQYLVTYSPTPDPTNNNQRIIIWDIRTTGKKRLFDVDGPMTWPMFRWSHDDKYFARIVKDILYIYETKTFALLEKKAVQVSGIKDFSWSPTDNIVAYWVAEDKDVPAKVTLMEVPSRSEIAYKNLFNVADCKIHWQKSGDYLCVKVDRYTKIKKEKNETKYSGMSYNFELFHMRSKQIPVDSIIIKEPIQAFALEPVGSKIAIIHGEGLNACISFYRLKSGVDPVLLKKIEKRSCNHIYWSPVGQYAVLANIGGSGTLDFLDTNDFNIMNSTEHYQMSDVEWDPTGRYVVTAVSVWKSKNDQGYWIWSFQGKMLKRVNTSDFAQFLWRPRLPTLLSEEQQKDIQKNLKKYYSKFESKDRLRTTKASKEIVEKRAQLKRNFKSHRSERIELFNSHKWKRLELRGAVDTDDLHSDTANLDEEIFEILEKEEEIELTD